MSMQFCKLHKTVPRTDLVIQAVSILLQREVYIRSGLAETAKLFSKVVTKVVSARGATELQELHIPANT